MKTYFISDLHLGHANCIRFDNRPWESSEEMDTEIIRRWNRKVRKEDHVYVIIEDYYLQTFFHSLTEKISNPY